MSSILRTATITWTIDDFPSCEANGAKVLSPTFNAAESDEIKWGLVLKPRGIDGATNAISLYLYLRNSATVFAVLNAQILSNDGGKSVSKSTQVHSYSGNSYNNYHYTTWGWSDFWIKDEHFRKNLLSNNTLTICVEVVFSTTRSVLTKCNSLESNAYDCELVENLDSLLQSHEFSDLVLSTNGKDFPAHKLILAARSKVFAAMFRHDTKENQLNRIEIEDMSEGTVAEMLRYIYTGRCENLESLAEDLLAAANKYDLNGLKLISGRAMYRTICTENALQFLILADTFNCKEFKNDALKFIASRTLEVLSTPDWKNLLAKSELVDEVCQALGRQLTFERIETREFGSL